MAMTGRSEPAARADDKRKLRLLRGKQTGRSRDRPVGNPDFQSGCAPRGPTGSDELVDQVLQELLPAACQLRLAVLEDVGFELREANFALLKHQLQ